MVKKSDIEKLGWKYTGGKLMRGVQDHFEIGSYEMSYWYRDGKMMIVKRYLSQVDRVDRQVLYDGPCENIQDMETIKRILKI